MLMHNNNTNNNNDTFQWGFSFFLDFEWNEKVCIITKISTEREMHAREKQIKTRQQFYFSHITSLNKADTKKNVDYMQIVSVKCEHYIVQMTRLTDFLRKIPACKAFSQSSPW